MGDVARVGVRAIPDDLGERARASGLGMLQRLENEERRPLTEHHSLPAAAEWAASGPRVVPGGSEDTHDVPCRDHDRRQGRVGATGEHDVGPAGAEQAEGLTDRVGGRGAGHRQREVLTLEAQLPREDARGGVRHGRGDRRGPGALSRLREADPVGLLALGDSSEAGADEDAAAGPVASLETRGREGLRRRREGVLRRQRRGGKGTGRQPRERVEGGDGGADGVLHAGGREPGETPHAGAPGEDRVGEGLDVRPERRHLSEPGHEDAVGHTLRRASMPSQTARTVLNSGIV